GAGRRGRGEGGGGAGAGGGDRGGAAGCGGGRGARGRRGCGGGGARGARRGDGGGGGREGAGGGGGGLRGGAAGVAARGLDRGWVAGHRSWVDPRTETAMLIEFSVENFLSFNERVTLSLEAAPELDEADGLLENTFEAPGGIRLLKSTLVFGRT